MASKSKCADMLNATMQMAAFAGGWREAAFANRDEQHDIIMVNSG